MKKIFQFLIAIFTVSITVNGFSQTSELETSLTQQINISNASMSSFGRYDHVRFVPRADMAEPCQIGTMYVNLSGEFKVCQDDGTGSGTFGVISEWVREGNDLYPRTGVNRVGIGTTNPQSALHVNGGNVKVTNGNLEVSGGSFSTEDMSIGQNLSVGGDASHQGNVNVEGTTNLNGAVNVDQNLTVEGVGSTTLFNRGLRATGMVQFTGDVVFDGDVEVNNDVEILGNITGNVVCDCSSL